MTFDFSFRFETEKHLLVYEPERSVLLCRMPEDNRLVWAKKISDILAIESVIEDKKKYYLACETDEFSGRYLALIKDNGVTAWSIPGRSFMHLIFGGFIYIIFIDEMGRYMLLKVDSDSGGKIWHHEVDADLVEYSFTRERILLKYACGKTEYISPGSGTPL